MYFHDLVLALGIVLSCVGFCQSQDAQKSLWHKLFTSGATPPPREGAIVSSYEFDNYLFIVLFGGRNSGGYLGDIWVFDLISWIQYAPSGVSPSPRSSFVGGTYGNKLVIMGGQGSDGALNDLWEYDSNQQIWTNLDKVGSTRPGRRYGHGGGVVTLKNGLSYLLVSHGFGTTQHWKDTWAYPLDDSTGWFEITPRQGEIPFARGLVASATNYGASDALLGMYGGCGSGGYGLCPSNEMWLLRVDDLNDRQNFSLSWELAPTCISARNYGAMAFMRSNPSADSVFVVYGGSSGSPFIKDDKSGQMNVFNVETKEWKQYAQQDADGNVLPSTGSSQSALDLGKEDGLIILQVGGTSDLYLSPVLNNATNELPCTHNPMMGLRTSHGVLMGIAWGFLIPMGIFVARFYC
jgi:hypothetical protein